MIKQQGPSMRVHMTCLGCVHEHSERYQVQGDSGCNVYCLHSGEKHRIADSRWDTPQWCPLLPSPSRLTLRNIESAEEFAARVPREVEPMDFNSSKAKQHLRQELEKRDVAMAAGLLLLEKQQ